ncbi:uncharacterized protein LOC119400011 [Rhipicephalus sanguineus]|uniref:Uncharacterized protein n=1 Tax=Rhipicephalus sanguineus TaxID=34632 RepID=A0A9D4PI34_RHISA|nr:uncharacterized protein LOC119400011 [Rhipicephalus sanguineus]KAH7943158.1 hypothetical protein HPB52_005947 [Rhipicephalus sanguineus]
MAGSAEGVIVRVSMNEGMSDLVQRLINPDSVIELVLRNCVFKEQKELLTQIGRCVRLRRLRCSSCQLAPSQLFQVANEWLPKLDELELSLFDTFIEAVDSEICNVRRIASRRATSRSSLRRLYVEVGGNGNFKLLRELLGFCPNLNELRVHVVRGGTFSDAVFQCARLHDELVRLEHFTFTSELPVPFPCEPDFSSVFSVAAAVCANVRHVKWDDSWSCIGLRQIANPDRVRTVPPQLVVVAIMNNETEALFRAAGRRHLWTHVHELCLMLLPPMHTDPFYQAAGGAFRNCLFAFFSVALEQVVELNLSAFHVRPELDLMELLHKRTLSRLQGFSAPPCAFRSQSAVRRLVAICPNLRDLDVRIQRVQGHYGCASCQLLLFRNEGSAQPPSNPGVLSPRCNGIARLTLCDVPFSVLLWFLECYGAAVTLRLAHWCFFESQQYGRLCGLLGGNGAIRCLVIQHTHLPIGDEHLQASLSLMTSLRHLCLLTSMPVCDSDAMLYVHQIVARASQLECVHIHYKHVTYGSEERVTWLQRRQPEVPLRGGPCFACCSSATFIGLVKPVNRDCEML